MVFSFGLPFLVREEELATPADSVDELAIHCDWMIAAEADCRREFKKTILVTRPERGVSCGMLPR